MSVSRLVLSALFLDPGRSSGTDTYARELVPEIAQVLPDAHLTMVTTRRGAGFMREAGWPDFCEVVALPADEGERVRKLRAEQLALPRVLRARGAQLVHSLANLAPLRPGVPSVVTIHDTIMFTENTLSPVATIAQRAIIRPAAQRAQRIITDSAAAQDAIVATLGVERERTSVVHLGPGRPPQAAPAPADEVRRRYDLPAGRIVLCVGAKRPHKNQELLIRALDHLPDDVAVVLVGHPEAYEQRLEELIAASPARARVRSLGFVPDADLEALWGMAACLAMPTRAEGFGVPLVEAMRRGIPVACSDLPVLREVGGDVPQWFSPDDAAGAAAAIVAAMEADDGARGIERAAQFSWRRAAEATVEAYERALASSR
jgi:glycosyltransferase involved in cell wall biosynthesis